VSALQRGVDIVIATPGRVEDLIDQGRLDLSEVFVTVIDEADHMADLGFLPGVTRIMNATPAEGQRLLFSATLDNGVDKLVSKFLHSPKVHSVDEANSPVAAMTHHVFGAADAESKKLLIEALASGTGRRILFMRTKHHAKKLALQLTAAGIPAVDLHGNLSQPQRDRNLAAFGAGDVRVLVATDVAARGVHVDDVELVVHVDPPMEHKAYLHRSGRTARAGSEGDVVTLVLPAQEKDLALLMRKAGIQAATQRVTPNSDAVVALIGERAEYVKPAPRAAAPQRGGGRSQGANAQRKRAVRAEGQAGGGQRTAQPRSDRSGRPARSASGTGRPARSGSGATASTRGGSSSYYSTSTGGAAQSNRASAPTGNPRRGGRRAQG
jgi:superfamily II DNA/RNA helicase